MTRVQGLSVLSLALLLGTLFVATAEAQAPGGGRRGLGMAGRGGLLGLLRVEQVRDELKLSEEQQTKVQEVMEKLGGEMREQFAALREIDDRDQRRAKMTELTEQNDQKVREELRNVLDREQNMRLYQIRMQVRPVADSLANRWVARRLELTEEQTQEAAKIVEESRSKQMELLGSMRDATQEQRMEAWQKVRTMRTEADEKALALLTSEQRESFASMKGEKIELPMLGRQR